MSNLYLKYRPKKLERVLGNAETVEALTDILQKPEKAPHVFLFHGPQGCGKTTMARLVAKELGIKGQDLREMDSADFRGIDAIRDIRSQAYFKPLEGKYRMWILDECHQLTKDAQNALLKILEDTPEHVYFALCTTDPQKLLKTVKDRCTQFQVAPLTDNEMRILLKRVTKAEKASLNKKVAKQIIKDSLGHPRAALQILDKVLRVEESKQLKIAKLSAEEENQSIELCRALLGRKPWKVVKVILKGLQKEDPESIRRHVLGYCSSVMMNNGNDVAAGIMEEFIEPFYDSGFPGLVFACYCVCNG